jgi:hypothetical protein
MFILCYFDKIPYPVVSYRVIQDKLYRNEDNALGRRLDDITLYNPSTLLVGIVLISPTSIMLSTGEGVVR